MEGESSAISGSRLNYRLTSAPAAAGAIPPSTCPVITSLLALYQECVDNGVWARVLYEVRGGIEKLTFLRKKTPPPSRQPGRQPASERRRARDKKRREAWAERRRNRSWAHPLATVNEGGEAMAVVALSSALVHAAPALARAVRASPSASSMPTSEDKAAAVAAPTHRGNVQRL
jgi:hypothetical protein